MRMEIILKYFPGLSMRQKEQFASLEALYLEWNQKINLVSRKDIDQLYAHHVLHSLAIAKYITFTAGTRILDAGTGGGFPGIPLSIMFPNCHFTLVDSIQKKIGAVRQLIAGLQLKNTTATAGRIETLQPRYDFIVSRAVTAFPDFANCCKGRIDNRNQNTLPNGIIYLKGNDTKVEKQLFGNRISVVDLSDYFEEEFFASKKLVYLKGPL